MQLFCASLTSPLFFGGTNLWLLLAMVARDQVNNNTGPQGGGECAPVIGDFGLLPHDHLQQNDTKSSFPLTTTARFFKKTFTFPFPKSVFMSCLMVKTKFSLKKKTKKKTLCSFTVTPEQSLGAHDDTRRATLLWVL